MIVRTTCALTARKLRGAAAPRDHARDRARDHPHDHSRKRYQAYGSAPASGWTEGARERAHLRAAPQRRATCSRAREQVGPSASLREQLLGLAAQQRSVRTTRCCT